MNEILTLVTFLALLFYTGIEMKFQLQMLQQNSYRNDRYNRWLKGESFATVSRFYYCCCQPTSCRHSYKSSRLQWSWQKA